MSVELQDYELPKGFSFIERDGCNVWPVPAGDGKYFNSIQFGVTDGDREEYVEITPAWTEDSRGLIRVPKGAIVEAIYKIQIMNGDIR